MFSFTSKLWFDKRKVSKKDGYVALYLQIYIGHKGSRELEEIPLKLRWPPDRIDRINSSLMPRHRNDPDANDYNMIIMGERSKHNEIAKKFRLADRTFNMDVFRREVLFNDCRKNLVAYMNATRLELLKKRLISHQTYKNVGTCVSAIKRYDEIVTFDRINERWMLGFKRSLQNRDYSPLSVWTVVKNLKHYLNLANDEVNISVDDRAIAFPNPEPPQPTTYLNELEVKRLFRLYDPELLSGIEFNVLKAFLFTCFTSLRISDVYKAGPDWMIQSNYLVFYQHKNRRNTPKLVKIPLVPMARDLINEGAKQFFELPTEQEYNRTLKDLAKHVGIHKRITSHVGRHTFGYLYMKNVGNLFGLKEIMGHSKISTTMRYAHLEDEDKFNQVMRLESAFRIRG